MPFFRVDCVSMYRQTYIVETENAEWAKDFVTCNVNGRPVDTEWIGETIVDSLEVTSEQLDSLRKSAVNGGELDQCVLRD